MKRPSSIFYFLQVCLICLLPVALSGESRSEDMENDPLAQYYKSLFLGEKKTTNYFGPLDSETRASENKSELWFLDDQFSHNYLNDSLESSALLLHQFWFKEIVEKSSCPDFTLGENVDYIRYLYRLLSISYLFESLKLNHAASASLGAEKSICSISFDDVFGSCKAQSSDMKKFHERIFGKFSNEISKISTPVFSKKEISLWLSNFKRSTSLTIDPVQARLHEWCREEKKNCRSLSVLEVKKALGKICNEDRDLIQNLCSEKDSLFGASYALNSLKLIQTSNAFNLINQSGMGEECLNRYVKIFSPKELRYDSLSRQFPLIYSQLLRTNSRYLQGELFLPGALKEFDNKGLSDFLVALKPPKIEPTLKAPPVVKPKPIAPVVVVKEKPVERPKPEPVLLEVPPPPKPKISEFEKAIEELDQKKLESLSINMESFHNDFEFSEQMISDLAAPIKKFQTRAALTDMKSYDKLGSPEAPVGLIFLKYLLDTENHQGLFNITTVLGDKFYVNNDIEKKDRPIFIELRNNESTKNRWQIIVMRSPKKP